MASQTLLEGRYLGGRPPYGYTLKDLGPHPNPAKAAAGRRLHGLTPNPATAPIVQRIFSEYLTDTGIFAIAERLTADTIPCPSAHDRSRNPHRDGRAWSKGAIRVILTNPRYTGRQVWNKQRTDEVLMDVKDVALGHTPVMRWNPTDKWVVSNAVVHDPLVSDEDFERVQLLLAHRARTGTGRRKAYRTRHPYIFKSLLYCAVCQRRMQGQHAHGVAYYRCRYPQEYALSNKVSHPKNVLMREELLITPLDQWLAQEFAPQRRAHTIDTLLEQARVGVMPPSPSPSVDLAVVDYDAKIAKYRAALEAGADPALVTRWIAEAQADRDRALALAVQPSSDHDILQVTAADLERIIDEIGDLVAALRHADPEQKFDLYRALGLRLTYEPDTRTVRAVIDLGPHRWDLVGVRGPTLVRRGQVLLRVMVTRASSRRRRWPSRTPISVLVVVGPA
jgi:hypothetical protein